MTAFFITPVLAFRREPKLRDEYQLTFSEDGIHFRTVHIDCQLEWSIYTKALVNSRSYLLYYGKCQFTVIPRWVFQDAEQQQAFEELLVAHVPRIVRRGA